MDGRQVGKKIIDVGKDATLHSKFWHGFFICLFVNIFHLL